MAVEEKDGINLPNDYPGLSFEYSLRTRKINNHIFFAQC